MEVAVGRAVVVVRRARAMQLAAVDTLYAMVTATRLDATEACSQQQKMGILVVVLGGGRLIMAKLALV